MKGISGCWLCLSGSRLVAAFLCGAALAGCAATPWPIPPDNVSMPFSSQVDKKKGQSELTMRAVSETLDSYLEHIRSVRRKKDGWSAGFSDTTFAGAMTAVAGGIASRTGLINIGAGVAALGLATDQHYATEKQSDAYTKAEQRLICVQTHVMSVSDTLLKAAQQSGDDELTTAGARAPQAAIFSVDSVRADLLRELSGLRVATPSMSDLNDFFTRYAASHQPVAGTNVTAMAGLTKEQTISNLTLVKSFQSDINACIKVIN